MYEYTGIFCVSTLSLILVQQLMYESNGSFMREYVIFYPRLPVDAWINWDFLRNYAISNPRSTIDVWINSIFLSRNLISNTRSPVDV